MYNDNATRSPPLVVNIYYSYPMVEIDILKKLPSPLFYESKTYLLEIKKVHNHFLVYYLHEQTGDMLVYKFHNNLYTTLRYFEGWLRARELFPEDKPISNFKMLPETV